MKFTPSKNYLFLLPLVMISSGCYISIGTGSQPENPTMPEKETTAVQENLQNEEHKPMQDTDQSEASVVTDSFSDSPEEQIIYTEPSEPTESTTAHKPQEKPEIQVSSRKVEFIVKDEMGQELFDVFTIAFVDAEGKQIRKFPYGDKRITFDGIKPGTYTISAGALTHPGESSSTYASQSFELTLSDNTYDTEVVTIIAKKK
ncbi:hypothetical protein H6758_00525 [Candidatus Nomurabacteria bacterium]|nr:hypothetical protein [Candidatus Nomurabacteria bacterium]